MNDRDGNRSNPYKPDPAQCCEACVFGRGEHAEFCDELTRAWLRYYFPNGVPFPPVSA